MGTIDKLAGVGNQRKLSQLFGQVDGRCVQHGYYKGKCCQKECVTEKRQKALPLGLSGPTLFVQDELHLLSEGLGTFDAHYETFVQRLRREFGQQEPLKIIASSATIEAFERQVEHLYGRAGRDRIFPCAGPCLGQSFYAQTLNHPQRLFVGIIPHNKTIFNTMLELIEIYHRETQQLQRLPLGAMNPYGGQTSPGTDAWLDLLDLYVTSLTYFLKIPELNAMRTDIQSHVNPLLQAEGLSALDIHELTGGTNTDEVSFILERLERRADVDTADAVLATSMVSHGVDVDRFNAMFFDGMPRQNAEYIQASSRVGRSHVGLVFMCLHPARERDQSHYTYFAKFHQFLGQLVEPVAINRWARFSVDRTLPGLFMGVLLQLIANGDKVNNPGRYYRVDFLKQKISEGSLRADQFIPFLEEAYQVEAATRPHEVTFAADIASHVQRFLDQIINAPSDSEWVSDCSFPSLCVACAVSMRRSQLNWMRLAPSGAAVRGDNAWSGQGDIIVGRTMNRGKQQILFTYLPGKTFDFEDATLARIKSVRGAPEMLLNLAALLRKVEEEARAWRPEFRPSLRDDVLRNTSRFVLLNPTSVEAEMFPKTLWCLDPECGHVRDYSQSSTMPTSCARCHTNQLAQLRFVKVHRCGALLPLQPPSCRRCNNANNMALEDRGSERLANFRWVCRQCGTGAALYAGPCRECRWPTDDRKARNMDHQLHRAGSTFYAHTTTLLNIPDKRFDGFFNLSEWPAIAAAKFLDLPSVQGRSLSDFSRSTSTPSVSQDAGITNADMDELFRRQGSGQITAEQMVSELQTLRERRRQEQRAIAPGNVEQQVLAHSGVPLSTWLQGGQDLLEAVMLMEIGHPKPLLLDTPASLESAAETARRMGLCEVAQLEDFPIVNATYGFSRVDYRPNECFLRPFPEEREHSGKLPIYVDKVQADALLIRLDHARVCAWLECNGFAPTLPTGINADVARRAFFVQIFDDVGLRQTLEGDHAATWMVFGLLHTLSHLCVRQAALLCGLERTSLSEYLLPRALTFAIYCNHRFGATIGALTALYEQSLCEWLNAVRYTRRCVVPSRLSRS